MKWELNYFVNILKTNIEFLKTLNIIILSNNFINIT